MPLCFLHLTSQALPPCCLAGRLWAALWSLREGLSSRGQDRPETSRNVKGLVNKNSHSKKQRERGVCMWRFLDMDMEICGNTWVYNVYIYTHAYVYYMNGHIRIIKDMYMYIWLHDTHTHAHTHTRQEMDHWSDPLGTESPHMQLD